MHCSLRPADIPNASPKHIEIAISIREHSPSCYSMITLNCVRVCLCACTFYVWAIWLGHARRTLLSTWRSALSVSLTSTASQSDIGSSMIPTLLPSSSSDKRRSLRWFFFALKSAQNAASRGMQTNVSNDKREQVKAWTKYSEAPCPATRQVSHTCSSPSSSQTIKNVPSPLSFANHGWSWRKSGFKRFTADGSTALAYYYCLILIYFDLFWFILILPGIPIHIRLGPCRQLLGSNLRHLRRMPAITSDVKSVFMSR